ncbi:MAG: hypothetical protein UX74_C0028G0004 [Parcubacteria group bacterium GW2011_GWA2_47_10b]|nr:MAG: hypothetical protein UX74_C0028G0004 [Parcubacteria group bacterium GW2011_GWA2_47_10b]
MLVDALTHQLPLHIRMPIDGNERVRGIEHSPIQPIRRQHHVRPFEEHFDVCGRKPASRSNIDMRPVPRHELVLHPDLAQIRADKPPTGVKPDILEMVNASR